MGPKELETAYALRKQGNLSRTDFADKMGYSYNVHNYLDHPDTRAKAESHGIEYVPHKNVTVDRTKKLPDDKIKIAYALRGRGLNDREIHRDPEHGFSDHIKDPLLFTKKLEAARERFPKEYVPSPRKLQKRPKGFESDIYKKSLSGMSHKEIAGEHGITPGNVRAIVSRQHRKAQKPKETNKEQGSIEMKPIQENWQDLRNATIGRIMKAKAARGEQPAAPAKSKSKSPSEMRRQTIERVRAKRAETDASITPEKRQEHVDEVHRTVHQTLHALNSMANNTELDVFNISYNNLKNSKGGRTAPQRDSIIRDNNFTELKEAELITSRVSLLQLVDPFVGKYFSQEWVRKNVLQQTDEDIEEINNQIAMEAQAAQQQQADAEAQANAQGMTIDPNSGQRVPLPAPPVGPNGEQLNPDGTPMLPSKFEVQANELEFAA